MVHNENAEWDEFEAQLDEVVPDTGDAAQRDQSDAHHDSQTHAQAQDEMQSACSDEDDNDLVEVDVDQFATEPQAEMEAESRTTAQQTNPTHEALATVPGVASAQDDLASSSSSTATTRSAEPHAEAAANRARATERGYLARRRAARKSASLQKAKKEVESQAGSESPGAPTPSASSSSALAIPTPSSSRAAASPATMPPPPPLPVGPTGLRQLWEGELKLGLPQLKAGYRIALPPARPASAPVVGAASAGPVPSVAARHQSAPVASTSRGKRSRDGEDRGERVVRKRAKANNSTTQSQQQRQPPVSSSIRAPRPQWIPYSAQQPGESRQREHVTTSRPTGFPAQAQQQNVFSHQGQQMHRITPPLPTSPPSTSTSQVAMQMRDRPRYLDVAARQAAYAVAPPQSERPMQPMPVAGSSRRAYEQEQGQSGLQHPRNRPVNARTDAMPERGGWNGQDAVPRTLARAGHNTIVPQQPLPATPEAGPSRRTYQQPYNRAGVQNPYDQPASPQSYMMPVPSGWNDPAAVPRTFTRAGSTMEGQSAYRQNYDARVAYAARPQQQMGRPVPSVQGGGGMAPSTEQLPSVDAPGSQPVYNLQYAPSPPMPTGWNSSTQLRAMSGGERVPAYLTMYAPPNHPPPGWNPQAPVYEQEPRAQSFSRGQSAYGYGYDF